MNRTILVHVGKCGGSTCRTAISESAVRIDHVVHVRQPVPEAGARYFIIARSPIARAISAFNWRHWLVNNDDRQAARFPGERVILNHYGSLGALAEQLYFPDETDNALAQGNFRSVHHLGEDIAFYLDSLFSKIDSKQVAGVVMQETLNADMDRLFGVTTNLREKAHHAITPPGMLALSNLARANLRRFLRRDFACLEKLREWGKLNPDSLPVLDAECHQINP